jgi:hypothetical protein
VTDLDLGAPISYLALERNTPVYSSDGHEIGVVAHVLQDDREDVFDGIVVAHQPEHHRLLRHEEGHCFADADDVDSIHERGVTLKRSSAEAAELPKPTANPSVLHEDPGARPDRHPKLRRAWDLISGNY